MNMKINDVTVIKSIHYFPSKVHFFIMMVTILKPAAGEIITWWSKVFTQCPPYATVL